MIDRACVTFLQAGCPSPGGMLALIGYYSGLASKEPSKSGPQEK